MYTKLHIISYKMKPHWSIRDKNKKMMVRLTFWWNCPGAFQENGLYVIQTWESFGLNRISYFSNIPQFIFEINADQRTFSKLGGGANLAKIKAVRLWNYQACHRSWKTDILKCQGIWWIFRENHNFEKSHGKLTLSRKNEI